MEGPYAGLALREAPCLAPSYTMRESPSSAKRSQSLAYSPQTYWVANTTGNAIRIFRIWKKPRRSGTGTPSEKAHRYWM